MDGVIRIFLRSELILLTKLWARAARGARGCWFPEELFQAHQRRCGSRGAGLGAHTFGAASYSLMKPCPTKTGQWGLLISAETVNSIKLSTCLIVSVERDLTFLQTDGNISTAEKGLEL